MSWIHLGLRVSSRAQASFLLLVLALPWENGQIRLSWGKSWGPVGPVTFKHLCKGCCPGSLPWEVAPSPTLCRTSQHPGVPARSRRWKMNLGGGQRKTRGQVGREGYVLPPVSSKPKVRPAEDRERQDCRSLALSFLRHWVLGAGHTPGRKEARAALSQSCTAWQPQAGASRAPGAGEFRQHWPKRAFPEFWGYNILLRPFCTQPLSGCWAPESHHHVPL